MQGLTALRYEDDGQIATITLARPERGNRIDVTFLQDFQRVCHHIADESGADVVVVRAQGPDFCRGVDFSEFRADAPIDIHGFNKWEKAVVMLERLPKVTVAALQGRVEGGGFQLALVCDQRVCAPDTTFSLPEVQLGFLPGMAVFRLAKYIGLGRARQLILTERVLDAYEALDLALVDRVAEEGLDQGISDAVSSFGPVHPVAVELSRRLLNESFHDSFEDAIGHFLAAQHRCINQASFIRSLAELTRETE